MTAPTSICSTPSTNPSQHKSTRQPRVDFSHTPQFQLYALSVQLPSSQHLETPQNHFVGADKMVEIGSHTEREKAGYLGIYPNNLETWFLSASKPRGGAPASGSYVVNMDPLAGAQPRELSRSSKTKFRGCLGIKTKDQSWSSRDSSLGGF